MFVYVVVLFLLLPALVLWAVPKTRRSAGDAVTAWKTVPFGCVTMLVLPNLLAAILFALGSALHLPESRPVNAALSLVLMIVGVGVGIRVITLLKNYIRKRYGTEETAPPESKKPYYFAFGCLAAVLIFLVLVPFIWFMSTGNLFLGRWRTYPVVTEHGTELAFQERPIHPFLAEYEYRVRFRKDGAENYPLVLTFRGFAEFAAKWLAYDPDMSREMLHRRGRVFAAYFNTLLREKPFKTFMR